MKNKNHFILFYILIVFVVGSYNAQASLTCRQIFSERRLQEVKPSRNEYLELGNRELSQRDGHCYNGCWIDSNLNRLEILVHDRTGQKIQLSSAYLVMNDLLLQANRIAGLKDARTTQFMSKGRFVNFSELVERVGLVPEKVMPSTDSILKWDSLVNELNILSSNFSRSLDVFKKKYKIQTLFGLIPGMMTPGARNELNQLRSDFLKTSQDKIHEIFGDVPNQFHFENQDWSAIEFAKRIEFKTSSTSQLITVFKNPKEKNGENSSDERYRDNLLKLPFIQSWNIAKIEQAIISFLKIGEPVPAGFDMAYNHFNNETKTFSFSGPNAPILKSFFDSNHAMTIVGYETDARGEVSRWIVSNNVRSDNRYYYFDKVALQKLLIFASFPFTEKNLDFLKSQLNQ